MELFFVGLIFGIVLGVWIAVGVLYLFRVRGESSQPARFNWPRRMPSSSSPPKATPTPAFTLSIRTAGEQQAFERLTNMVHSPATAERLVGYEHDRRPYASTLELIETAIEHWIRDNH